MKDLSNVGIERGVLAGIYNHGHEAFFDTQDIIQTTSFINETNSAIYRCFEHIFSKDEYAKLDIPSVMSASKELGLEHLFTSPDDREHLRSIINTPVHKDNIRKFSAQLRKLEILRLIRDQLQEKRNEVLNFSGNESINEILAATEIDFSRLINKSDDGPRKIGTSIIERYKELAENPVDQVGISTGYPVYDKAIGGGLRGGSVNVIGARMKIGKSVFSANIAWHVSRNLEIPVLYLDTELRMEEQQDRITAKVSGVKINNIETGKFAKNNFEKQRVFEAAEEISKVPYYHISVAGLGPEDQLAIMRRWIRQVVGLRPDGKANECLVILDYLKMTSSDGLSNALQEYQALGFHMTSLHNFSMRYDIPIFTLIQLNRDGITKESTDTAGGSDRILQLCTNFSIFKPKSDEEIAEDGIESGNRKLVVCICRHGPGLEDKNYINMYMDGPRSIINELDTKFELNNKKQGTEDGRFEVAAEISEQDSIPFNQ